MKLFNIKKYDLELKIIKNKLYLKNLETNEIEKINIDYYKYGIIYNPAQIKKLTILNSEYSNIFIQQNLKSIKIINSTVKNIEIDKNLKEIENLFFVNNIFENIIYNSEILKVKKFLTNIDKKLIDKKTNKKLKIDYFKYIELPFENNYKKKFLEYF